MPKLWKAKLPPKISHDFRDGGIVRRSLAFQQLSIQERLDTLREMTDFALILNPDLLRQKRASRFGPVDVVTLSRS